MPLCRSGSWEADRIARWHNQPLPMSSTSSSHRSPSAAAEPFLAALAAGLPASCSGGFPVVVGVSGGADSVGLLLGLVRLLAVPIVVAHAEHDLRAEAADDRRFVEGLAAALGLPCEWRRLAVRDDRAEQGEGLEARARRLRYDFLAEVAHARGGRHVLVAHTADDQAETILHRILRGTGVPGLAGMQRARELCDGVALLRPLLDVTRADVRRFVAQSGTGWREDASNADCSRARNFLRHELLPRCATGPYPAAAESLLRLGRQAAAATSVTAEAATFLLDRVSERQPDGGILIQCRELVGLGAAVRAELVIALWRREHWPRRDLSAVHVETVATLLAAAADAPPSTAVDLPGGLRAEVRPGGRLHVTNASALK
ncbi:MAG: tRNA(Ile)-lysidine synthase [Planctomycetota bacterium]